jgi:hypothetical protein
MNIRTNAYKSVDTPGATFKNFCIAVIFSIAFGYIEAAVVVYLREIFYPNGFDFPLSISAIDSISRRLLLTEVGREAATLVLILTGAQLFGRNLRQRIAYFMTIFAVWDIFYYVWLKVLLNWPASIMDWDILFLIPVPWAGPVLAPVLVSGLMLVFAMVILYRDCRAEPIKVTSYDWFAFTVSAVIVIVSFCIPGPHTDRQDYASYFYWSLFAAGMLFAVLVFVKCLMKSKRPV